MSLAQKTRSAGAPASTAAPATSRSAATPAIEQPAIANSDVQSEVGASAAQSTPFLDMAAATGEDPGKFQFAEDDTRKQQSAPLPGVREKHAGAGYHDVANSTAFVQGTSDEHSVDPNDVGQGQLGDCYLLTGMAAVARADPNAIARLIKDNGDGTYNVTLHLRASPTARPKPKVVTVDGRLPAKAAGTKPLYAQPGDQNAQKTELWPALIEKALAQVKGSYEKISGGNIGKDGFAFAGATEMLTGRNEGYFALTSLKEDDALLKMGAALEAKKPVSCDSKDMSADAALTAEATKVNVYGNHAYAPTSVDLDGRTVSLQNPWGSSHVTNLPIGSFMKYFRSIRVGA